LTDEEHNRLRRIRGFFACRKPEQQFTDCPILANKSKKSRWNKINMLNRILEKTSKALPTSIGGKTVIK
jgi:hypothetical protein